MSEPALPFVRRAHVDKPGIIGAQWWQDSVATQIPRRKAVQTLAVLGGVLAGAAVIGVTVSSISKSSTPSAPAVKYEPRSALAMQKLYGWDFGAEGEALVFDGQSTSAFDRAALAHLPEDLAPRGKLVGLYVRTLFDSPAARPTQKSTLDSGYVFKPLDEVLMPIHTAEMDTAFARGAALASVLAAAKAKHPLASLALLVDLPGPEAVAFAAGLASTFEPVFLFDNWPHPRGVVPAHRTLAAAAYYQPLFAKASRPAGSPAVFVLDRARLTTYSDESTQFDNRYVAKAPPTSSLVGSGVKDLLYIAPSNATAAIESDDFVDAFLEYAAGKLVLHAVPVEGLVAADPSGTTSQPGYAGTDFWADAGKPEGSDPVRASLLVPRVRTTQYSSGYPTTAPRPPASLGYVPVAIAVGTGAILGAQMARNGSWNRTTYGGYSGTGS